MEDKCNKCYYNIGGNCTVFGECAEDLSETESVNDTKECMCMNSTYQGDEYTYDYIKKRVIDNEH